MVFNIIWSYEARNEILLVPSALERKIWTRGVVVLNLKLFCGFEVLVENCLVFFKDLTLINILSLDAQIRFSLIPLDTGGDFSSRTSFVIF